MRQWHDERLAGERIKHLSAIGMIVGMPQQQLLGRPRVVAIRLARFASVAEDVVTPDRFVDAKQKAAIDRKKLSTKFL